MQLDHDNLAYILEKDLPIAFITLPGLQKTERGRFWNKCCWAIWDWTLTTYQMFKTYYHNIKTTLNKKE